jgi:hypothetical protein
MRGAYASSRTLSAGCGGRDGVRDEARLWRTAKPCGPDAPTLASSRRRRVSRVSQVMMLRITLTMVATKPGHQGERGVSRKTIAQGRPECSGSPVVLPPCFFHRTGPTGAIGTRLSLRPLLRVALRPLCSRDERFVHHSGRVASRDREPVPMFFRGRPSRRGLMAAPQDEVFMRGAMSDSRGEEAPAAPSRTMRPSSLLSCLSV